MGRGVFAYGRHWPHDPRSPNGAGDIGIGDGVCIWV